MVWIYWMIWYLFVLDEFLLVWVILTWLNVWVPHYVHLYPMKDMHTSYWSNGWSYIGQQASCLIPGGALGEKNSRGAPLEVQNGTQQDLNKMIDLVSFGGQKDRLHAENGGLRNETQQDLNKMVNKVKFLGSKKIVQVPKMGGKTAAHTYWLSKRECPPPPGFIIWFARHFSNHSWGDWRL